MHFSIEPRDRIYVKGYIFLLFAKNIGTLATLHLQLKLLKI